MEDGWLLIVFFILYLVAGSSGKKKKTRCRPDEAQRSPMRTRAQGEQLDMRVMQRDQQTMEGFGETFVQRHDAQRCEGDRIHLHEVSDMLSAAEGEDPCHGGDSAARPDLFDISLEADEAQRQLREDVLRGVIMSEILTRPHERRLRQRKEYHG